MTKCTPIIDINFVSCHYANNLLYVLYTWLQFLQIPVSRPFDGVLLLCLCPNSIKFYRIVRYKRLRCFFFQFCSFFSPHHTVDDHENCYGPGWLWSWEYYLSFACDIPGHIRTCLRFLNPSCKSGQGYTFVSCSATNYDMLICCVIFILS